MLNVLSFLNFHCPHTKKRLTGKVKVLCFVCSMGQTQHHRPAKTVFSTLPSNSDWQKCKPVEFWAGWRGAPLASNSVSRSCKEQLKIGICRPVVWHLTFSGVWWMITCRLPNILCRLNIKLKWQQQQRIDYYCLRALGKRLTTETEVWSL